MEPKLKLMELVAIPVLLALLSLSNKANAYPRVPCYFVFGDSLSDNGNNNKLPTLAKVNYPPYGIDFPQGPTGRFCNGRNMHDFIAQLLGLKDNIPAFVTSKGRNIFNGVNYASGSAGIRKETGSNLTLYNYGARKFAVYGIGQIGCTPYAISMYGTNRPGCVLKLNKGATLFNNRLKPLIHQLNNNLTDAKFTYLNPSGDSALATLGHLVSNTPCCTIGGGGGELCLPHSKSCKNSSKFIFWDGAHPTEALNKIFAKNAYTSKSPFNASPLNIQQLAMW
ncbi:hypothetical protein GQ457_15G029700 [Hibiscus cannabinus]